MRMFWMRRSWIRSCCGTFNCFLRCGSLVSITLILICHLKLQWKTCSNVFPFFTQVTRVDGEKLLPYRTQLVQILQLTLRLRCKQGYSLACNLLHHVLRSMALTYPTDYCSVPGGFNRPLSEYLPIKVLLLYKYEEVYSVNWVKFPTGMKFSKIYITNRKICYIMVFQSRMMLQMTYQRKQNNTNVT